MILDYFKHIQFSQPYFFALVILLPILIYLHIKNSSKNYSSISFSTLAAKNLGSWKASFRHLPFVCRLIAIAFLIVALANPQVKNETKKTQGEGIEIMLCLDVSGSMMAQDLSPNRLEAAKAVAIDFVNKRQNDRLGLVVFAGESFTQCPLTPDHGILTTAIENVRSGLFLDGTAIGDGLATSVDRLRYSKTKTKIIVLLTDGENNGGLIDPKTAKEIAKSFGIKVYTIGVGTDGEAVRPTQTELGIEMQKMKVSIDEKLLKQIANETGGQYFRAKDNEALKNIYTTINTLEKSLMLTTTNIRFEDKFLPFAVAAAFFMLLEIILKYLVFRKFP